MRMLRILGSIIILFSLAACYYEAVHLYPKQFKAIESFCEGHNGFRQATRSAWDGRYKVECKDGLTFEVPKSIQDMRE